MFIVLGISIRISFSISISISISGIGVIIGIGVDTGIVIGISIVGMSETGTEEFKEFLFVGISVRKSEKINRSIVFQ